ncbi:hypothetical protein HS088_TW18G00182 [Tripterygium wilfordii]|uniref:Uncharacterized protein n=1 Tax=Tripterygium wilfordii TaxID=458696 RepID=A0A7J7CBE0_TRIWF|nr:hypothetical protein HS088_TW18G00182 [Tripterygium wilfordii]
MQKKESQSLGICHRLFNFITKSLFPRSLKTLTWGSSSGHEADLGSEIPVFFKQSEEQGRSKEGKIRGPGKVEFAGESAAEEQEEDKKKGKSRASENGAMERPAPVVRIPRLWSVDSNINEKSDEFIRSKMEAMKRNVSLEPDQSP